MARETHLKIPSPLSGYELKPRRSELEIVIPEATTNLVTNPGFELNTTGWGAAGGGTLVRVAGDVYRGAYCGRYTPSASAGDGIYFGLLGLVAGQSYALSVRVKGAAGQRYRIFFADGSGNAVSSQTQFTATGRWQYVWLVWRETSTASRRVYIAKGTSNTSTLPFYVDDVQVENKGYPTTYCDGDMRGFVRGRVDYTWSGRPHQSTSSRSAYCAHGGRVVNVTKYGLRILAYAGLGFGFIINRSAPLMNGGSIYDSTIATERQFTVAGIIEGKSQDIRRRRADLAATLHANRVGLPQPVMLRYTPIERGEPSGDTVEIPALYESGLQNNLANDNQDQVTLTFSLFLPYMSAGRSQSSVIPWQTVVAPTGGSVVAWASGGYSVAPDTGLRALAWNPIDGMIYSHNGTNPVIWDPYIGTVTTIAGSSLPVATAGAIEVLPNGDVLYGVGSTLQRYRLSTATWDTAITCNGTIETIAYSPANGYIAIGGQFSLVGATSATRLAITTDNMTTWQNGNANATVRSLAWSPDGDLLYIGGDFTQIGPYNVIAFAYLSMATGTVLDYSLFGAMFSGSVNAIAVDSGGTVYVGGSLGVSAPDVSLVRLSRRHPATNVGFSTTAGSIVSAIVPGPNGQMYVAFDSGGVNGIDGWPSSRGIYVVKDGTARLFDLAYEWAGEETLTVNSRGDVAVAGRPAYGLPASVALTIDNQSSTDSWPTITVDGPGTLMRIANETTGVLVNLQLDIQYGERVLIEFAPDGLRIGSPGRPNLLWSILPGSNIVGFKLTPGANAIKVFLTSTPIVSGGTPADWYDYTIGNVTAENSDNGKLYVSIVDMGSSNRRVDIYRDAARTALVARSNTAITGTFILTAQNGSGLTGYMRTSASPVSLTTNMTLQYGLALTQWPVVYDSVDAAVE